MSSKKASSLARQQAREEQLRTWGDAHRVNLDGLDEGQKWLVFAALQILAVIGQVRPLRRVLGYFLAHCGMGLGSTRIAALLGLSDRAVRLLQAQSTTELLAGVRQPAKGHRPPKLGPAHAGPLAKYLVAHPNAKTSQLLQFIAEEFGVTMDRLTLRRYLVRYGLGCLREDQHTSAPLF